MVWRFLPGAHPNPRAADLAAEGGVRDYEAEDRYLDRLRQKLDTSLGLAQSAILRLTATLRDDQTSRTCVRCRQGFVAHRNHRGTWYRYCLACRGKLRSRRDGNQRRESG